MTFGVSNADKFIVEPSPDKIISGFYNDTFLFGRESSGVPNIVHKKVKNKLKIPMV